MLHLPSRGFALISATRCQKCLTLMLHTPLIVHIAKWDGTMLIPLGGWTNEGTG